MAEVVIPNLTIEGKKIIFTATNNYLVGVEFGIIEKGAFAGYEFIEESTPTPNTVTNETDETIKITVPKIRDLLDIKKGFQIKKKGNHKLETSITSLTKGTKILVWTDLPKGSDDDLIIDSTTPRGTLVIVQ